MSSHRVSQYDTFGFHSISHIAYSKMMVRLINNLLYWHQLVQQFFPPLVRKPGRPHLKRNDNLRKFVQCEFQPTFWSEIVRLHASWVTSENLSWLLSILLFTVVCKWSIFLAFAFPIEGTIIILVARTPRKKMDFVLYFHSSVDGMPGQYFF